MSKDFFKWFKLNIGSCLSWAITFAWLIFIYFKIHNGILPTNLNEFGDFIAGAFAPLAFFWLVRGFYQQGKGLEQNSEALTLQADELRKTTQALELQVQEMKASVEQQTRLAAVYEEELKQKHFQVQPYFEYEFNMSKNYEIDEAIYDEDDNIIDTYIDKRIEFQLKIINLGELARNLIVKSRKGQPNIQKRLYKFENSEMCNITFEIDGQCAYEFLEGKFNFSRLFKVAYQDIYGKQYEQYLSCDVITYSDFEADQIDINTSHKIISKEEALARVV